MSETETVSDAPSNEPAQEAPVEDMPEEDMPVEEPMIEDAAPRSISLRLAKAIINNTK